MSAAGRTSTFMGSAKWLPNGSLIIRQKHTRLIRHCCPSPSLAWLPKVHPLIGDHALSHFSSSSLPSSPPPDSSSFPMVAHRTSGRQIKRLQRRKALAKYRRQKSANGGASSAALDEEEEEEEEDKRTWRTILFPPVYDEDYPRPPSVPLPKNPIELYKLFSDAWAEYKSSWDGYFSNHKPPDNDNDDEKDNRTLEDRVQEVSENVERNRQVSREEGQKLVALAQERTGIYSVDDAKAVARELLTVATLMLGEFMKEYRKGRDDEAEKMKHEYFQDEDEDDNKEEESEEKKKQKRRPKRRIPISLPMSPP